MRKRKPHALSRLGTVRFEETMRVYSQFEPRDGHWVWHGAIATGGTPQVMFRGVKLAARRLLYGLAGHEVRSSDFVYRTCDEPLCVRPDHARIGPPALCGRGLHEMTPENRANPRGCLACKREKDRERKRRLKEAKHG